MPVISQFLILSLSLTKYCVVLSGICIVLILMCTCILALITHLRQVNWPKNIATALYCGRVSHTRYVPVKHSFSYPLFFCLLDLEEEASLFRGKRPILWPLSLIMNFHHDDHLKNGEGLTDEGTSEQSLSDRIRRLVFERTGGKCTISSDQKIFLLTHLKYFGYCFNPVSFYYVMKKNTDGNNEINAIVAEVSNTPWNEMQCYVLHPDSKDINTVKDGRCQKITEKPSLKECEVSNCKSQDEWRSINYIFRKTFHVSPFMDMNHTYDWTFWHPTLDRVAVSTSMLRHCKQHEGSEVKTMKYFNAYFDIHRSPFTPIRLCYQLVRFPVYCLIIQIWIHIEALKLFIKGVEFIPHPGGSESSASRIIGNIMAPIFSLQALAKNDSKKTRKIE